jgi:hypothetical protein
MVTRCPASPSKTALQFYGTVTADLFGCTEQAQQGRSWYPSPQTKNKLTAPAGGCGSGDPARSRTPTMILLAL